MSDVARPPLAETGDGRDGEVPTPAESARALAGTVRSTFGPNGRDKMLVGSDGTVVVTNDGASILDRLDVEDPVARVLSRAVRTQRARVGDGATGTLLLVDELLSAASSLVADGYHPTTVVEGYALAATRARERLPAYELPVEEGDEERLRSVAKTAVTGRWDDAAAERFAGLAVSGLRAVGFDDARLDLCAYPGGELRESTLLDGVLVDTDTSSTGVEDGAVEGPRTLADARVAMLDAELAVETPRGAGSLGLDGPEELDALREHERSVRADAVRAVSGSGADALFCQKSVDGAVRSELARAGVLVVERTRRDEFDALARATDADPTMAVADLSPERLGRAGEVRRRTVGTADTLVVTGGRGESRATLLLRGGTPHVAEETERIVEDCRTLVRRALRDEGVLPGGGAAATALARDLGAWSEGVGGREAAAVEAFADSLEAIPRQLATNAGLDPVDSLVELRTRHSEGDSTVGIGRSGALREMVEAGVLEPSAVLDRTLTTAFEAVSAVLRVDDVLAVDAADAPGSDEGGPGGSGNGAPRRSRATGGYPWAIGH
ncbi:TCP-1/cpn60 chaperonin family protein [Halogeometricum sp. S1BR25-6]|uniref:TCP-1/cpn60 chaperonin family protein n=1 Tax=Halogeometricum salsisoli TaxID=2950536 RepID=A0ABU2GGD8_9EURY|nr:TCP-1/cpn60 chaperonin family protein [Halogeometricum sp. S1BR25-6]MDS0299389.1 TCP-1/cpn60 chaperonin family protein [Halogeometricum sp. S1BR25-6]